MTGRNCFCVDRGGIDQTVTIRDFQGDSVLVKVGWADFKAEVMMVVRSCFAFVLTCLSVIDGATECVDGQINAADEHNGRQPDRRKIEYLHPSAKGNS